MRDRCKGVRRSANRSRPKVARDALDVGVRRFRVSVAGEIGEFAWPVGYVTGEFVL